jgi:hypothetical protein
MNDDPCIDPFISDAPSMGLADIHLIACAWAGGLVLLTLAVVISRITKTALQRGTIARSVARRRLIFTNAFGTLGALATPLPMALTAGADGIACALICEVIGAVVIALFVLGFGAASAHRAARRTDRCANSLFDDDHAYHRSYGVNPATGYPMVNSSVDAGGYAFGCGPDYSDDRHWDR